MYTIITRNECTFCDKAKELLSKSGTGYVEYNIQSGSSKWLLHLLKKSSITTVPQIFRSDGTYVGGYTELKQEKINDTNNNYR